MTGSDLSAMTDWSWWRRLRFFMSWSLALAVLPIGFALLASDLDRGLTFSKLSPTGAVPLWPVVGGLACGAVIAAVALATLLPLYRYPRGGYVVGFLGCVVVFGGVVLAQYLVTAGPETAPRGDWTDLAVASAAVALAMWICEQARPLVAGEGPEAHPERAQEDTTRRGEAGGSAE